MWKICLVCLLVFIGCNEVQPNGNEVVAEKPFASAKKLYQQKKYQESAKAFRLCCDTKDNLKKSQARLGEIVSLFLAQDENWKERLDSWKEQQLNYYWDESAFYSFSDLSKGYKQHFEEQIKLNKLPSEIFHVADFLISQGHQDKLTEFIEKTSYSQQLCKFVTAKGWKWLNKNNYEKSLSLFSSCLKFENVTQSTYSGLVLSNIFANQKAQDYNNWVKLSIKGNKYFVEDKVVTCFQEVSYGTELKKVQNSAEYQMFALSDMLFSFGYVNSNKTKVWMDSHHWLQSQKTSKKWQEAKQSFLSRFQLGIAWQQLLEGKTSEAKRRFSSVLKSQDATRKIEAKLGLAILDWNQEESLDEAIVHIEAWSKDYFWIGGRKYSLFRSAVKRDQQQWEKLFTEDKNYRLYLIMFDSLCILGQNRSSHTLLGKVIEEYSEMMTQNIYEQEKRNIPKDVYADSKIWEKLD